MPRNEKTLRCDRCFRWVHWTIACSGDAPNVDAKKITLFCHGCKPEVKSSLMFFFDYPNGPVSTEKVWWEILL